MEGGILSRGFRRYENQTSIICSVILSEVKNLTSRIKKTLHLYQQGGILSHHPSGRYGNLPDIPNFIQTVFNFTKLFSLISTHVPHLGESSTLMKLLKSAQTNFVRLKHNKLVFQIIRIKINNLLQSSGFHQPFSDSKPQHNYPHRWFFQAVN